MGLKINSVALSCAFHFSKKSVALTFATNEKTEDDIIIYRNAPKGFYACYVFSYEFLMFLYMDEDLLWEKILLITNQKQDHRK